MDVMGRGYVEKMKVQDIKFQTISSGAIANLIVAGEVPLSPTIYDSNISLAKKKGAGVEWWPLEPALRVRTTFAGWNEGGVLRPEMVGGRHHHPRSGQRRDEPAAAGREPALTGLEPRWRAAGVQFEPRRARPPGIPLPDWR